MKEQNWTQPEYDRIVGLVAGSAGLVLSSTRRSEIENIIQRMQRAAGAGSAVEYLRLLERDQSAVEALIAELTIGETYFFRDAAQFDLIRHTILPAIAAAKPKNETIRVWSAGCASGEEAYSLAIVLHELGLAERAHVIGTDIARARLERAQRARYGAWSFRGVPAATMEVYFRRVGREFQLRSFIRERVEFHYLNLAEDVYPALSTPVWGLDLILCRNVLIYLDAATVTKIAARLMNALATGGWLLLGASDPAIGALTECEVSATAAGLAYRARSPASATRFVTSPPPPPPPPPLPGPAQPPFARAITQQRRAPVAERAKPGTPATVAQTAVVDSARVRALANQGKLTEAEQLCAAALERKPMDAELLYLHALLLSEAGHHAAAVRAARQSLYLEPGLVVAQLALGSALVRLGDTVAAARAFANAERMLTALPPGELVPASDGETVGRLLEMARVQRRLIARGAA